MNARNLNVLKISMAKNNHKIYQAASVILLAIIISSLLNVCLFSLRAKAAPLNQPKLAFAYGGGENCSTESMPMPTQTINRPIPPIPECCLTQNRNFNAVVNTANDKSAPVFTDIITPSFNLSPENNRTHYTSQTIFPPPEALALAATVIRE